jgi:hypothetical protein
MYIRCEQIKRIRHKPIMEAKRKDGSVEYRKVIMFYGRDLVTIQLSSNNKDFLDIKNYVEGEKNPKREEMEK